MTTATQEHDLAAVFAEKTVEEAVSETNDVYIRAIFTAVKKELEGRGLIYDYEPDDEGLTTLTWSLEESFAALIVNRKNWEAELALFYPEKTVEVSRFSVRKLHLANFAGFSKRMVDLAFETSKG